MCRVIIEGDTVIKSPIQLIKHFLILRITAYEDDEYQEFDENGCLCQIDVENTLIKNRILFTYDQENDAYIIPKNVCNNTIHSLN